MTSIYHTYRKDVPLATGQTLAFTKGKGYFAKGTPTGKPSVNPIAAYINWWKWGIKNRTRIGYSEGAYRLEGEKFKPGTLPLIADCSGLTFDFADWAHLKLPYNGVGNTDTLMQLCAPVTIAAAQPGDIIVFGPKGRTNHTVTILERVSAKEFICGSHGSSQNPCHTVRFSDEAAYQATVGPGVWFLRIPT